MCIKKEDYNKMEERKEKKDVGERENTQTNR
jgi:hypothetical protein